MTTDTTAAPADSLADRRKAALARLDESHRALSGLVADGWAPVNVRNMIEVCELRLHGLKELYETRAFGGPRT